ncbi:transcription factor with AP2 domain, putative [Babesia caballi]|uniref:Transcription factor with AP2 domain, putative n=1 Tax=Babesia caballi TaxID=5871 RepID=A0AAV4LZL6_BABCB|nr:transcription factor with AP2 domain, putative [Babesia caballi]
MSTLPGNISSSVAAPQQAPATAATTAGTEAASPTAPVSPVTRNTGNRGGRAAGRKVPIPPPPRATPSSSSGYPGVSWNKRMGAWLSFYYDADTRRSRTFHPKYYDFDVEKAKQAAIEFMKSIEKHPRCSLRKSRRDAKTAAAYMNAGYNVDQSFLEAHGRTRKRAAVGHMMSMDPKARTAKSPLSCPTTQTSMSDMPDMESLKRNFQIASSLLDPCYMSNANSMDRDYMPYGNVLENNYLSGSFESQQDYDKGYQSPMTWPTCHNYFGNPEYYMDSHNYSVPFLEGDVAFSSPNASVYPENELFFAPGPAEGVQPSQRAPAGHMPPENPEAPMQSMFLGNHDSSPANEDAEIHMLMQSIALSPSESFEGFRLNAYNYGDGTANYGGAAHQYISNSGNNNGNSTPLGSPYLSPYVQTLYSQFPEDSELNRTFGFQNLLLGSDTSPNQQTQPVMNSLAFVLEGREGPRLGLVGVAGDVLLGGVGRLVAQQHDAVAAVGEDGGVPAAPGLDAVRGLPREEAAGVLQQGRAGQQLVDLGLLDFVEHGGAQEIAGAGRRGDVAGHQHVPGEVDAAALVGVVAGLAESGGDARDLHSAPRQRTNQRPLTAEICPRKIRRPSLEELRRRSAEHLVASGDLEVAVDPDEAGGLEGEADEVREGVPVPVLREHQEPGDGLAPHVAAAGVEGGDAVLPAGVHEAGAHDGAELGHDVVVLLRGDGLEKVAHLHDVGAALGVALLEHETQSDEGALPDEVAAVGGERVEKLHDVGLGVGGAADSDGHGRAVAYVGVVRGDEQLQHARDLLGGVAEHEADGDDGGAANVVRDVRDGGVEQRRNHLVGVSLAAVEDHADGERAGADDLFVLRVDAEAVEGIQHLRVATAEHQQPDGDRRRLAGNGAVLEKGGLEVLVDDAVAPPHADEAEAQRRAVVHGLVGSVVAQVLEQQVRGIRVVVVGEDEADSVEGPALRVGVSGVGGVPGQTYPVNNADRRRRRELGPVVGLGQPAEVVAKEDVAAGARLHDGVGDHDGVVGHAAALVDAVHVLLEQAQVGVVLAVQKLQVELSGALAGEHALDAVHDEVPLHVQHGGLLERRQELLVAHVDEVVADLVGAQVVVAVDHVEQELRHALVVVQPVEAGDEARVVPAERVQRHGQQDVAKVLVERGGKLPVEHAVHEAQDVVEQGAAVGAFPEDAEDQVQASRVQRDADGVVFIAG